MRGDALEQQPVLRVVANAVGAREQQIAEFQVAMGELDDDRRPVLALGLAFDDEPAMSRRPHRLEGLGDGITARRLAEHEIELAARDITAHHDLGMVAAVAREDEAGDVVGERLVEHVGDDSRNAVHVGLATERGGEFVELRVARRRALDELALVVALERDGDEPSEPVESRDSLRRDRQRAGRQSDLEHAQHPLADGQRQREGRRLR